MTRQVTVFVNDEPVFVFDAAKELEQSHLEFFDKMDADMKRGIKIKGELIENPAIEQRCLFVAMNLLKALKQENNNILQASASYLLNRQPELHEIRFSDAEDGLEVELVN